VASFVVEIPIRIRRAAVVDVHLEQPFESAIRIEVDAADEEEAAAMVSLMLASDAIERERKRFEATLPRCALGVG
jgi:hypothetical protein